METIFTRQNTKDNINKIAAQKQLYIRAKQIFLILIILSVPGSILISLTKLLLGLLSIDFSTYSYVYSISVTLIELILISTLISEAKTNAAKIQEDFDCSIYQLRWHGIVVGKKPTQELINKYSEKFKSSGKDISKLYDWYPTELVTKDHYEAVLLCQKTNLNYDASIRKSLRSKIYLLSGITFMILLIVGLLSNSSLANFLLQFIVTSLPVFTVSIKLILEQTKTIKNAEELKSIIDTLQENKEQISIDNLRSIQDKIFNSRKESSLIPEFYYDRVRNKLEKEMHKNASTY